jgi:hypothetical protein
VNRKVVASTADPAAWHDPSLHCAAKLVNLVTRPKKVSINLSISMPETLSIFACANHSADLATNVAALPLDIVRNDG